MPDDKAKSRLWALWLIVSLSLAAFLAHAMFYEGNEDVFMPGPLSAGHHQLSDSCGSCHTDGLGGTEVLQQACLDCHADVRVKPFDSHPRAKFEDPRNADLLGRINATECVSCHVEHKPEITLTDGLTQPRDVCFHCHANIGKDRPSHQGMDFMTCKDSGCHNFHNNRALYTDFLVKHMDAAATNPAGRINKREFAGMLDELMAYPRDHYPVEKLSKDQADAPEGVDPDGSALAQWVDTAHADAGVNCSACHQPHNEQGEPEVWRDSPGLAGCVSCHESEVKRFGQGKHGMRLAAGLSPMTPSKARLAMDPSAGHQELTCNSCHGAHQFDIKEAAVDGCLGCHADEHSLAYKDSTHYRLWQAEMNGQAPKNSGVSCASCHMPRIDFDVDDYVSRKMVDHNQSATLSPNSKMIRPACLSCHGLPFAIDAMADRQLIRRNFNGQPQVHVRSVDLAREDQERHEREQAARKK